MKSSGHLIDLNKNKTFIKAASRDLSSDECVSVPEWKRKLHNKMNLSVGVWIIMQVLLQQ